MQRHNKYCYRNEIVIITKAIPPVSQDMASFASEGPTQGESSPVLELWS